MPRIPLFAVSAVLATAVCSASALGTTHALTPVTRIAEALPTVADVPGAGLAAGTEQLVGARAPRAPYPCADPRAQNVRTTGRWGEWSASGRGRSVRVVTFAYSDALAGPVWRSVRNAIDECPRTNPVREDDGSRGTATVTTRRDGARTVHMEVRTRSAAGSDAWSLDHVFMYQRVGDAIQRVTVTRRVVTAADRAFASRIAAVTRRKYLAGREAPRGGSGGLLAPTPVDEAVEAALADVPEGARVNVSMGDSMASGEAGRWRGNVFAQANWPQADAYGAEAYWDTPTGESIPGCHRAKGSEIHIPGTYAVNIACSSAKTTSMWSSSPLDYGQYKPGIDDGAVNRRTGVRMPGQLTLLAQIARRVRIGTIVMSIGGNDMGFANVVTGCMAAFMRPWPFTARCQDDPEVQARLSDASLATVERKVEAAIIRVHATMRDAGYANDTWQMIIQGFPRLLADDSRYADTAADKLFKGGCPIGAADAAWLNARLPMTTTMQGAARGAAAATGQPVHVLDLTNAFAGRELCARGAEHVDRIAPGEIVARAERVQMVRVLPPFGLTEGMHPNQIGQQALQACVREAINGGAARSGRCDAPRDWSQVDADGLPLVRFTPTQ